MEATELLASKRGVKRDTAIDGLRWEFTRDFWVGAYKTMICIAEVSGRGASVPEKDSITWCGIPGLVVSGEGCRALLCGPDGPLVDVRVVPVQ